MAQDLWPGFLQAINKACEYKAAHYAKLPSGLRSQLDPYMPGIDLACAILKLWDFEHAGGKPASFE